PVISVLCSSWWPQGVHSGGFVLFKIQSIYSTSLPVAFNHPIGVMGQSSDRTNVRCIDIWIAKGIQMRFQGVSRLEDSHDFFVHFLHVPWPDNTFRFFPLNLCVLHPVHS